MTMYTGFVASMVAHSLNVLETHTENTPNTAITTASPN